MKKVKYSDRRRQHSDTSNVLASVDVILGHLSRVSPGVGGLLRLNTRGTHLTECLKCLPSCEANPLVAVEVGLTGSEVAGLFFVRSYLEVLYDSLPDLAYGYQSEQLDFLRKVVMWPMEDFIELAKFVTAYPMDKYLRNNEISIPEYFQPKSPKFLGYGPLVFSGRVKRMLKLRLTFTSDKNTRLWAGILQGVKRGCQSAPQSYILRAMVKHKKILSTKDYKYEYLPWDDRLWDILFSGFHPKKPSLYEASPSAAFERVRSLGGAREVIRDTLKGTSSFAGYVGAKELVRMLETDKGVESIYGWAPDSFEEYLVNLNTLREPVVHRKSKQLGPLSLADQIDLIEGTTAHNPPMRARVGAVLEPLKVRLITKGEAFPYWLGRHWQKELWQYLQTFPQFVLTGAPVQTSHLNVMIQQERALNLPWEGQVELLSGDYSAATDRLKLSWTQRCHEGALSKTDEMGLPPLLTIRFKEIMRSILYAHEVSYPESYVKYARALKMDLEPFTQVNGQLMGSITSFPILCFINLVCYWKSMMERFQTYIPPRKLPVLVNGDDILFRTDDKLRKIWERTIGEAGFIKSLGKNYHHPTICCICSQFYRYNGDVFKALGYLNTGLLTNVSKLQHTSEVTPIWENYNYVVQGAMDPERASKRFLHYNSALLKKLTSIDSNTTINAFIPRELGGLGFKGHPGHMTRFQRRLAWFLLKKYKMSSDSVPGYMLELVNDFKGITLRRRHHPVLVLEPIIGPHNWNIVELVDPTVSMPILAASYIDTNLGYKFNKQLLSQFRKAYEAGRTHILPEKHVVFPYKVMELNFPSHWIDYVLDMNTVTGSTKPPEQA